MAEGITQDDISQETRSRNKHGELVHEKSSYGMQSEKKWGVKSLYLHNQSMVQMLKVICD